MLNSDNLYDRGQALEIFLGITNCDTYDWFQPPSTHSDRLLHSKMLELANYPLFLDNLLANRNQSYPGGSFRALQLLAFWLSWVRALYTQDQQLLLSSKLLRELEAWSQQPIDVDNGVIEEEIKLAQTVFDDFRQAGTAESASNIVSGIVPVNLTEQFAIQPNQADCRKYIDDTAIVPAPAPSGMEGALSLKEQGNKLFRQNKYDDALEKYQSCLTMVKQLPVSSEHDALLVLLYTNISNTLWKSLNQNQVMSSDREKGLQDIEHYCEQALALQPQHAKASYRLLMTKIDRGDLYAAFERAEQLIRDLTIASSPRQSNDGSMGGDVTEEVERFRKLQRKCIAKSLLMQQQKDSNSDRNVSSFLSSDWGLSTQKLQILSMVLKRNQLQHLLPSSSNNSADVLGDITTITTKKSYAGKRISIDEENDVVLEAKLPPAVNQMLNQLFDDHDVPQSLQQPQPSKKPKKRISETNSIPSLNCNAVKISNGDRKKMLALKKIAADFAAFTLRSKEDEDLTIQKEQSRLLLLAKDILTSLLVDKCLLLKDLYGSVIDEHDLLLLLSFVVHTGSEGVELSKKILQQIPACDRIKSVVFLFNMEFGHVQQQVLEKIAVDDNDSLRDEKSLQNIKALLL